MPNVTYAVPEVVIVLREVICYMKMISIPPDEQLGIYRSAPFISAYNCMKDSARLREIAPYAIVVGLKQLNRLYVRHEETFQDWVGKDIEVTMLLDQTRW